MKACPYCAEMIQDAAVVCRFCRGELGTASHGNCWSCGAAIGSSDEVCRRCGERISPGRVARVEDKRPNPTPAGAIIGGGVVLVAVLWFLGVFQGFSDSSGRAVLPQSLGAPAPVVTKAEYDRIQEGMTYEQVVGIIGARGEELSRSDIAGFRTVMYSWTNSNGSNMNAMFQNSKLVQKAQFGLPN